MKRSYKVRFNLGKGKNYMKWKVEGPDGVNYYDPSSVNLIMRDCQLKNNKATAKKIHAGAHKTVCAWVRCAEIFIKGEGDVYPHTPDACPECDGFGELQNKYDYYTCPSCDGEGKWDLSKQISYNPRSRPHWTSNGRNNLDDTTWDLIISNGHKLLATNGRNQSRKTSKKTNG